MTAYHGRPVLEGSVSHNVKRTATALVDMNAVTASGVKVLPALQTLTASTICATLQPTPTLHVNTVMPTRMVAYQGAQMTACVPPTIPSVDMAVDPTYVAVMLTKIVERMSCVTLVPMSAIQSQMKVVTVIAIVLLTYVMNLGLTMHATIVMLIMSVNQVVLMMESVRRTNQSVELVDSLTGVDAMLTLTARLVTNVVTTSALLRMSVLGMLTARMVSVMLTILLTILNVNFVKMENANLDVLTAVTALMGTSATHISAQLMKARPW